MRQSLYLILKKHFSVAASRFYHAGARLKILHFQSISNNIVIYCHRGKIFVL